MTSPFYDGPPWAYLLVVAIGVGVTGYGAVLLARHPNTAWRFVRARFSLGTRFGLGLMVTLGVVGVLFWAFTEVIESWREQTDLYPFDAAAHDLAVSFTSPPLTALMKGATMLGNAWVAAFVTAALAAVLVYRREARTVLALGLLMGPGEGLVYALKAFFARVRPVASLIDAGGYSFPSGHSFTAAALYGFMVYLLWGRNIGTWRLSRFVRIGVTAFLLMLIVVVGASRIYLGVHYFTDVAGGFVLAALWLLAVVTLVHLFYTPSVSAPSP